MLNFKFIIIIFFTFFIKKVSAQSINVDFLFSPGVTLGTEYLMPSAINDSTDFQLSKYNFKYNQPLKTKIGIKGLKFKDFSFKKLDAKASQIFLNYSFSIIQPSLTDNNSYEKLYKVGFGVTAITASIRKGIWLYSGNISATENTTTLSENLTPNFRGYFANIKTKNLKTFYFYGAGLVINQGQFIPFPLLGIKTKLGSKLRTEIILPLHIKFNYRFNNKVNLDIVTHFNGINSVYREGSTFKNNDQTLNFRQLKSYIALNSKLGKHYKIKIEGGYSSFQQIYSWSDKTSQKIDSAPYVAISVNYHFGKSVFGNFINQAE